MMYRVIARDSETKMEVTNVVYETAAEFNEHSFSFIDKYSVENIVEVSKMDNVTNDWEIVTIFDDARDVGDFVWHSSQTQNDLEMEDLILWRK